MVQEPAQPPASSGVEACWGLALLAKMLWLFPISCNRLSVLREPSTHPRGELQVATVGSMLYFMFLGDAIMFISSLCNLFYTLYIISEGKKKKVGKYLKQEKCLKYGEVTKQGDKHLGRLCQGCLWLGLGAEPEASKMVGTISVLVSYSPYNGRTFLQLHALPVHLGDGKQINPQQNIFCEHLCLAEKSPQYLWSLCCGYSPPGSTCCPQGPSALSVDTWEGVTFNKHKGPLFRASCQQFTSPSLHFSSNCSFTCFFHLCSYWKKAKQMKLT